MRYLQIKFFSYKLVHGIEKDMALFIDEINAFLNEGHYIITATEVKEEGLMLFYKHKDELKIGKGGKLHEYNNR